MNSVELQTLSLMEISLPSVGMLCIGMPMGGNSIKHEGHYITSDGNHFMTADGLYYTTKVL